MLWVLFWVLLEYMWCDFWRKKNTRVVCLETWILQIMVRRIIFERRRPWFPTVLRDTGPHLSHTCPTRHLKVQRYEDTCAVACVTKKGNEFERQPSLSGLPLTQNITQSSDDHHRDTWTKKPINLRLKYTLNMSRLGRTRREKYETRD